VLLSAQTAHADGWEAVPKIVAVAEVIVPDLRLELVPERPAAVVLAWPVHVVVWGGPRATTPVPSVRPWASAFLEPAWVPSKGVRPDRRRHALAPCLPQAVFDTWLVGEPRHDLSIDLLALHFG
jgi:hypothetical protein